MNPQVAEHALAATGSSSRNRRLVPNHTVTRRMVA